MRALCVAKRRTLFRWPQNHPRELEHRREKLKMDASKEGPEGS
jgi:hypothetical protein